MKKNLLYLVALIILPLLLFSFKAEAQKSVKISGTVISSTDKLGIPGVSIQEKGTNNGTITDLNGKYSIQIASPDAILVFTFIGYQTEEVSAKEKTEVNVTMTEKSEELNQVVVVGYGSMKKSDISGSVVSVSKDDLMKKTPTNILQGLQGVAAGVMVSAQDGAPDANLAIRIRGVATINGNSEPLYVVDGVQVGNNANFLAPSDVESMEVLKDASATAIYGSKGANGVIMITTKHGKAGSTHITFSADYGIQTRATKLEVGDIDQFAANIRAGRANDGAVLANQIFSTTYDGKRKSIDWQNEMTRTSLKSQYNVSATGGTDKTQSNLSVSFLNNDGIVINTNYNRLTVRANVVSKVADFLEVGGDINFVHSESHGSNASFGNNGNLSSLRDFAFMCPTLDYVDDKGVLVSRNVRNANGTYGVGMQTTNGFDGGTSDNMYAAQMENNGLTKNNKLVTSAYANINLYKGLTFKTIASYQLDANGNQNFWGNHKRYEPDGVTLVSLVGYDARQQLTIGNSQGYNLGLESFLTYAWKNQIHNLTLMAGSSMSQSAGTWSSSNAIDFPADNIRDISLSNDPTTRTGTGAYNLEVHSLSYFGRATYSLLDRYIFTGTIRKDGSSNFGINSKYSTFPSAALAWRVSEESFLKDNPMVSNLKLRLGWGQTGNMGRPNDKNVASLSSNSVAYYYYAQNGTSGLGSTAQTANGYVSNLVDPNVKWETNEQSNLGFDLGFLNNTLNITVDVFKRTAKDLLLDRSIRPSAGEISIYTNYGSIENTGIEFSVNYKKNIDKDWNISATLTGSSLKNKIVSMGSDLFSENTGSTNDGSNVGAVASSSGVHWNGHSICRTGYAVGSYYGYQVEGVFQSKAEVDALNTKAKAAGHTEGYQRPETTAGDFKYKDMDGNGYIDDKDMTILGDGFPKVNYGLNLNVSYKNWDLSVNAYGVYGQKINSYSAMTLSNIYGTDNGTIPNILTSASAEAWTPANHSNSLSRLSIIDPNYNMRGSSAWVKDGDFLKIGNIQVGYNFDKRLLKPLRMESARIYASIQNVACFSSYNKYGDPEIGQGSVLFTGLDTGRYPNPRIYAFGLNVQF